MDKLRKLLGNATIYSAALIILTAIPTVGTFELLGGYPLSTVNTIITILVAVVSGFASVKGLDKLKGK